MKIQHLFFDLDRTLWDFETNSDFALRELFDEFNLGKNIETPDVFIAKYKAINDDYWNNYRVGKTTKEALRIDRFRDAFAHFGLNDVQLSNEFGEKYIERCSALPHLFPGTLEMLSTLKEWGYTMHIITNGFAESQYKKMEKSGLRPFFDQILCSDEVGFSKPSPEIFLEALKRAGAKANESIMLGDHPEIDILGAVAIGMKGIWFNPSGNSRNHPSELQVNSWEELPLLLRKLSVEG